MNFVEETPLYRNHSNNFDSFVYLSQNQLIYRPSLIETMSFFSIET